MKPGVVGCWPKDCGAVNGSGRNTANEGNARLTLANWCNGTGVFHDWLEGRGPRGCLMDMVDDATSRVEARMGKEETIWAAVGVLRAWIRNYGVPRVLYTDWKNVYKRKATGAEQMRGKIPVTQFGR